MAGTLSPNAVAAGRRGPGAGVSWVGPVLSDTPRARCGALHTTHFPQLRKEGVGAARLGDTSEF